MRIMGVRGRPKLVGKEIYRDVFRQGNTVLKVQRGAARTSKLRGQAVAVDLHNREIRKKLDFFQSITVRC